MKNLAHLLVAFLCVATVLRAADKPATESPAAESNAGDLTAAKIRQLAEQPEDRSSVSEEMSIFAHANEATVKTTWSAPGERGQPSPPVTAREKLVGGGYLVTTFRPHGLDDDLITVVYFDDAQETYQKRLLLPDDSVHKMIGTRVGKSRVLSWVNVPPDDDLRAIILTQENHSDDGVVWREVVIVDGKVVRTGTGEAVFKRPAKE